MISFFFGEHACNIQHIFSKLVDTLHEGTNYFTYDLDLAIVLVAKELANITDIHDRLITATVRIAQAPIITRDRKIKKSKHASVVWQFSLFIAQQHATDPHHRQ